MSPDRINTHRNLPVEEKVAGYRRLLAEYNARIRDLKSQHDSGLDSVSEELERVRRDRHNLLDLIDKTDADKNKEYPDVVEERKRRG